MELISVVFWKEVVDNFRDRRSVFLALLYPLIGPVLVGALVIFVAAKLAEMPSTAFTLPVHGAENGPQLSAFLEERQTKIGPAAEYPRIAVRIGEHDTALVIPEGFGAALASGRPAELELVVDGSRLGAVVAMSRALALVKDFNQTVGDERLRAHGVDPAITVPVSVNYANVAVGRNLTGFFFNMMPPFIMFTVFIGGMYLAIDATSGERERGSLEPLLANPIARWEVMAGKVGAALLYTAFALIIQLAVFKFMFDFISAGKLGLLERPAGRVYFIVFVISVPLMLLAVAVQMIIATVTRSFKETQTYLGLLPMVPALPGIVLVFVSVKAHAWMLAIPTFGQIVLTCQLMRGDDVSAVDIFLASIVTTGVAMLLLLLAARLYKREEMVFGS